MTEILRYLTDHLAFLFAPGRFRFVDSLSSRSFGGDALVVLTSDTVRIRLVRDRGQLFLGLQGLEQAGEDSW